MIMGEAAGLINAVPLFRPCVLALNFDSPSLHQNQQHRSTSRHTCCTFLPQNVVYLREVLLKIVGRCQGSATSHGTMKESGVLGTGPGRQVASIAVAKRNDFCAV